MFRVQVFTDGRRDCIERTISSAGDMLNGPITERVIHDDSGDPANRAWLEARFPDWQVIGGAQRSGFDGAIIRAWAEIADRSLAWWVFHLEDDFIFRREVDLIAMAGVLAMQPHLVQMALRRQPVAPAEIAAGGVVECFPDEYAERSDQLGNVWLEHRLFFTTNPSVYSTDLCRLGWPFGEHSEARFTARLLRDGYSDATPDAVRFGYWGSRDSGEAVEHIGAHRVGTRY